jgi:peroxiredoxin
MSIKHAAAEQKAKTQARLREKFNVISGEVERIRGLGFLDRSLKVGQTAPEFTLLDAYGREVSLKTLLAKGPVVVSFYRGEWCPYCNIQLHGLQEALPKMQELGATLVAISPEKPDHAIVATEKNNLTFPVLSDFGNNVARQFGIVFQVSEQQNEFSKNVFKNDIAFRNGEDSYELPVPATYVIDTKGVIRFAHADVDYMTGRAEPEAVVAALEVSDLKPKVGCFEYDRVSLRGSSDDERGRRVVSLPASGGRVNSFVADTRAFSVKILQHLKNEF